MTADLQAESVPSIGHSVVSSHNEWDPLEEVIVGTAHGASVPPWHVTLKATLPPEHWDFFRRNGGRPFSPEEIRLAEEDLDGLARRLESEGITVRRPDRLDHSRPYRTPDWESPGGLYAAMPRDLLLVIGDEILETPMAWRSRYFEVHSFRRLLQEYFLKGARWSAAPRPRLDDALFDEGYEEPADGEGARYVIRNCEPTFDAADFLRCGRDLFYFKSHVTNDLGVRWLEHHLGRSYRLHELFTRDRHPMHIDTTFCFLGPGKLLVNPERAEPLPPILRSWDVLQAPPPCTPRDVTLYFSSGWLSMNILMLDPKRVVVADHEELLIGALRRWGFEVIPCRFIHFYRFGGSIHCATLDVRRRGVLESYF